jgi:hypothetical protein
MTQGMLLVLPLWEVLLAAVLAVPAIDTGRGSWVRPVPLYWGEEAAMLLACVLLLPSRVSKLCQPVLSILFLSVWKGAPFVTLSVELMATSCACIAPLGLGLALAGHA